MNLLFITHILFLNNLDEKLLFWLLIVPIGLILILAIIAVIIRITKMIKLGKVQAELVAEQGVDKEQQTQFLLAFGGKENIVSVGKELSRLTVEVKNIELVQTEQLQTLGATGILLVGNLVKATFRDRTAYIYEMLK